MAKYSTPICRYGLTIKGTRNRRHQCNERCAWSGERALEHFRTTGYCGRPAPIQIRYSPCPCGKSYADHWLTASDNRGGIKGLRLQPCDGHTFKLEHFPDCLCEDCETYQEDRRIANIAAAIPRSRAVA